MAVDSRIGIGEPVEIGLVDPRDLRALDRLDGGGARFAIQQRHLTDHMARPQNGQKLLGTLSGDDGDLQAAVQDRIHGVARIAGDEQNLVLGEGRVTRQSRKTIGKVGIEA